jgi:integrase
MTKMNMPALQSPRLLDQVRERIRYLHYSLRTEEAYVHWVKGFIRFHQRRHPAELSKVDVEDYLMFLANERKVSASMHRQALSALLFLYSKVLLVELPWLEEIGRPREVKRLPVVLSMDEVKRILQQMSGEHLLVAQMLYGTGMRILEALRARVKDIDFDRRTIIIREAKGNKDRAVVLPATLIEPLKAQLARAPVLCGGIICMSRDFSARSSGLPRGHALANLPRRIRSGILLPRRSSNPAMTSAPCRNCWVMPM